MAATPNFNENALIDLAASCRYSPKRWSRVAWDWGVGELSEYDGPRPWQDDINDIIGAHLANPETRYQPLRVSVASGHGIGKSAEMGMLSNWAMSCFADCKIVTTANTEGQLRTKTAPEIGKWFRMSITSHWFDVQTMSIKSRDPERGESWRQDFIPWSEHNTEAFAGLHNKGKIILLLFDEASKIHDKVWEVAEGALTDENTVIIWVVFGNPTRNSGRFRECFRKFRHRWAGRQIDSRTVPGTNKTFLQQLVDDNGEDSDIVKVRVRGQFPSQSAMQFISADDVDASQKVHLRKEQYSFAPVIISVDPAWTGDDSLEIMLRQGLYSKSLATMAKNDNDVHVANIIARLEDEYQADAVFIDAGYGTGIYSAGQVMGRSWRLIWFSGKAINPGYVNKRAEMWGTMKAWLKAGGAIDPKDEVLYQDLIGPETVPKLDGKIQLESKEDMKERGIPSPNRGDALALTFAEPVAKKVRAIGALGTISPHHVEVEYDPLTG
ncbi:terminase [Rhizobium sp. RSm-3]|uniref:terminase n=1 Tax=unclassified Rhizobium TaxID=2613769 RepID=UPI0008DB26CF|nr:MULTISPECIES: terminase [unclassified Rhizobium]OHV24934.1 terminase [Rhizobium sp. RSm-3]